MKIMGCIVKRHSTDSVSIYELYEPHPAIKTYIASTRETRSICNKPEIFGRKFINSMRQGLEKILAAMRSEFSWLEEQKTDIITILRGGINFSLSEALHNVYGFNKHTCSFLTSERYLDKRGKWRIKHKQYAKLLFKDSATIFIGDIVATGTTLKHAFRTIFKRATAENCHPSNLVLFTIGCERAEHIAAEYHKLFSEKFRNYERTYIIYIEGRFSLATEHSPIRIKIPGTDLLRWPALLAPEFELSQYERVEHPLEACVVYDAGSRAFDAEKHIRDVAEYWKKLCALGSKNLTLYDALKERWPETEYSTLSDLAACKKEEWQNISEQFIKVLYQAYINRWSKEFIKASKEQNSLVSFCKKRLDSLNEKVKRTSIP